MSTTVVTGFSPSGYEEYGRKFLETFDQCWPDDVALQCYVEEPIPVPRDGLRNLWDCPGVEAFIKRHRGNPARNGRSPLPQWRPKDRDKGYSYRHDSVKFSRQCFIPETAAAELSDGDILAWMDGDVVSLAKVPDNFIDSLLVDFDVCYLGRENFHTELGFWAVRLNKHTRVFLAALASLYRTDRIFNLPEWHSAYAFDHLRRISRLRQNNLTPNGRGHVWMQSPMAAYTDHLKGDKRKKLGRSMERTYLGR